MRRVSVAEVFGRAIFVKISEIPVDSIVTQPRELRKKREYATQLDTAANTDPASSTFTTTHSYLG